jgi:two-component system, NtrC family, response regulator GlrR
MEEMKSHGIEAKTSPRVLWIGATVNNSAVYPGQEIAHEQILESALLRLENTSFDCVIAQLAPDVDHEFFLQVLRRRSGGVPLLIQLEDHNVAAAVLLAHNGAARVYGPDTTLEAILNVARQLGNEHRQGLIQADDPTWRAALVGQSDVMRRVGDLVARVALRKSTVLITGETGTGKEVVADAIHAASKRCSRPFLAVNCGALPEGLLESELFGHKVGAFTGAVQNRMGLFERANGGTVFLDEVGKCRWRFKLNCSEYCKSSNFTVSAALIRFE